MLHLLAILSAVFTVSVLLWNRRFLAQRQAEASIVNTLDTYIDAMREK